MDYSKQELEFLRQRIVAFAEGSDYDHRPSLPARVRETFPHLLEDGQLQYARVKEAVAAVLQPRNIFEVGIGWGVSANAFIRGCPGTNFVGIDNGEMGVHPVEVLPSRYFTVGHVVASDALEDFNLMGYELDLIHIDGGHGLEQKARDVVKAFKSKPEWILIDDIDNVMVAAGAFAGIYMAAANSRPEDALQMIYLGNSHTGNLLIHAGRKEPEYRPLRIERI